MKDKGGTGPSAKTGRIGSAAGFRAFQDGLRAARDPAKSAIRVCTGTGCAASGSLDVLAAIAAEAGKRGSRAPAIQKTGCRGFCQMGPLAVVSPAEFLFTGVKPEDAADVVDSAVSGRPVQRLLVSEGPSCAPVERIFDVGFYKGQRRIAMRNLGHVDPTDIDDAIAAGCYSSLVRVLEGMQPGDVIAEIEKSGLRGRGGAGFPTGRKWRTARAVPAEPKYVICNADEGDPGAFVDRSICEGDPHSVIEGMIISAFAVGSSEGYVYVREEYPLAVEYLSRAVEQARERGLLGKGILGTSFDFDVRISRGGGAFVCGESTALMRSVAGEVGEPRAKYVRSVVRGLFDKPTVLNNVETFVTVPYIIGVGAENYAKLGTRNNAGTKAFSVVGKVRHTGLVEVELGTTLRQIIFGPCGGILDDRPFKAVQTGGPSGGCLPASELDLSVDFDTLSAAGSMMGSGGMIVMDDRTCMVDVARYFIEFLADESCGKCVPCREGLVQLGGMIRGICAGRGREEDLARIEALCSHMAVSSLCALGKSAPNPVLSTIRYFRDEYDAHIRDRRCPAGVCRALSTFAVDESKCSACGACQRACPAGAIEGGKKEKKRIDPGKCTRCGACRNACPEDAISPV